MTENTHTSRLLSLAFTDLVGSTALKTDKGDAAASLLIARHRELVATMAADCSGRIVSWAGDGCFLTFETPSAATEFALKLQHSHAQEPDLPRLRIGLHMGEVTERTDAVGAPDVEGLAVDLAARIQSLALPEQILMSAGVFNSARQRVRGQATYGTLAWRAHGPYLFKGFDDSIDICEVGIEGMAPLATPEGGEKAQRAVAPTDEDALGWRPAAGLGIPGHAHWVLDEHLGIGGFGEVWLATNTHSGAKHVFKFCFEPDRLKGLKREVVLFRLLKETLGDRDDIARVLDWELEKAPYFIESEYSEAGDLKNWADEQGVLADVPLDTRLSIVAQVATALAAAHTAGVLHKDIKPRNILVKEAGGTPKAILTDFGIGLLTDPNALKDLGITTTGLTQTLLAGKSSTTSGTAMYLAPELHEGKPPSEQSDIYALGVMMYQLVMGDLNHAIAPGWERDIADPLLRSDIAACVEGDPARRIADASELADRLHALPQRRGGRARLQWMRRAGIAAAVGLVITGAVYLMGLRAEVADEASLVEWAREVALPDILRLVQEREWAEAYDLAVQAEEHIPDDPLLQGAFSEISNAVAIVSQPEGASVSYKPYDDVDGEWHKLGSTPMEDVRLPLGLYRWQVEMPGHRTIEVPAWIDLYEELNPNAPPDAPPQNTVSFTLSEESGIPEGMVAVQGGMGLVALTGLGIQQIFIPPFYVDKTEVTNKAFKEFVDAGGYNNPDNWIHEFKKDGRVLTWERAKTEFVDTTGRPGPAEWELGDYSPGTDNHPVKGISWYEAAAYAEFRGKALPTIYHWQRAGLPPNEIETPLSQYLVPLSNFGGNGTAPAGEYAGLGASGTLDMAGNVREWCWNETGAQRYSLGGSWNDPEYMFTMANAAQPFERSEYTGFRCVQYGEKTQPLPEHLAPISVETIDFDQAKAVSDEVYEVYRAQVAYPAAPLEAAIVASGEETDDVIWETVSFNAAYDGDRVIVHLAIPRDGSPPYRAAIFFPGVDALFNNKFSKDTGTHSAFDAVPKSGRVAVFPVVYGSWERGGGPTGFQYQDPAVLPGLLQKWTKDVSRTIDYLETREDIVTEDLAYVGLSLGAAVAGWTTSFDERIKVAILVSGGLPPSKELGLSATQLGLFPRITIPTLVLNGRWDYLFPYETNTKKLFEVLGTPDEHKRQVVYEAGHWPLPRNEVIKELTNWLDTYQPLAP